MLESVFWNFVCAVIRWPIMPGEIYAVWLPAVAEDSARITHHPSKPAFALIDDSRPKNFRPVGTASDLYFRLQAHPV